MIRNIMTATYRLRTSRAKSFFGLVSLIFVALMLNGCASLTSTNYASRMRAVNKITDQNILFKVVMDDSNPYVQLAALSKLSDQDMLYNVALKAEDKAVKQAAFNKITDQNLINRLAIESGDAEISLNAVRKVTDQDVLHKIVLQNPPNKIMAAVLEKCEPETLSKIMKESIGQTLKLRIVNLLNDQKQLINIVIDNDDWTVRQAAFGKLNEGSLDVITREAKDPASVLAANIRLGRTNWKEAFSVESSTAGKLGDVIGAAALVDDPQPTPYDVVAACHNFIGLGDASRIPELINLLNRFGDVSLAEDYINCGHDQLYEAGARWGSSHGYSISTGNGSHRVQWGEKK
jgi:uncharacterized protein YihD (DUF1040 family)